MQKGKFGIAYNFYAALGFILAIMGQSLLCTLLLGFVIIAEQHEWTARQVIQALLLSLISSLAGVIGSMSYALVVLPVLGGFYSSLFSVVRGLIIAAVVVCSIIGLVRVIRGQDAGIPLAGKFSAWAYGIVEEQRSTAHPPPPPPYDAPPPGNQPPPPPYPGSVPPPQQPGKPKVPEDQGPTLL